MGPLDGALVSYFSHDEHEKNVEFGKVFTMEINWAGTALVMAHASTQGLIENSNVNAMKGILAMESDAKYKNKLLL